MNPRALLHVLTAAIALTLFNAAKPVTRDDPSYLQHAQQIAAHPLDPYGGEMFVYQTYGPALHNNAPPVHVYWLGLGQWLLGDHPLLWKLWLLPWALMLAFALWALVARVAPGTETPVVWMTLLSPALLPGFDFMLDVPELAMSLGAIALFARAADRGASRGAVLAGLVAGLAMQTKYTGVEALAVILAYGWATRRLRLALVSCIVAGALVVGWEALMYARYGDTPILHYLGRRARGASGVPRAALLSPLFRFTGTLATAFVPFGLLALGASRRVAAVAAAWIAASFAAFAFLPERVVAAIDGLTGGRLVNLDNLALGLPALAALAVAGLATLRCVRRRDPLDLFLLLWLAIEVAEYFAIVTAPGARRVYGVLAVLILLIARVASEDLARAPRRAGQLRVSAAFGVLLGLAFWAVDFDDALAQRDDVGRVLSRVHAERAPYAASGSPTIWYAGNHFGGFQFYAPRAGMHAALTGRSALRAGDWLVIPLFVQEKYLRLDHTRLERVASLAPVFRLPITTRYAYYIGKSAFRRPALDWVAAEIYRVTGDGIVVMEDLRPR